MPELRVLCYNLDPAGARVKSAMLQPGPRWLELRVLCYNLEPAGARVKSAMLQPGPRWCLS